MDNAAADPSPAGGLVSGFWFSRRFVPRFTGAWLNCRILAAIPSRENARVTRRIRRVDVDAVVIIMNSNGFKHRDIALDKLRENFQHVNNLMFENSGDLSFIEAYRNGRACVALYFLLNKTVVNDVSRNFLSKYDCNTARHVKKHGDNFDGAGAIGVLVFNGYTGKGSLIDSWYQKPVFVGIAELVETPNERIISLVRFYPIKNYIRSVWAGQLDFTLRKSINELCLPLVNREVNMIETNAGTGLADNFNSNEVEGRPQIVNSVSDNDGDVLWHGFTNGEIKALVSGIRIFVDINAKRITIKPIRDARFEFIDVTFGPLYF